MRAHAVVELIDDLRERVGGHCQIALNELLHEQRSPPGNPHPPRDNEADPFWLTTGTLDDGR
jgi:hypothetical protein